ncbi:BZ3500_MvSof-1268-A1-R1_Chr1-1g00947 [Microbotryum saponariae]|uniref:BZ3500_MvSof-1268-A1-R1_Chr1-1g00947 protein n=1 Tax=Microbotryum saponariae TaxID=289078 RepID=A0A2X0K8V9_9BASI|nr:BZ3500_MvSof-1268-A1-R1_Chr1-1g00947 [Microbotryum saponariae]SCZ93001.1 BZ3501_MvSof-1269-A2-R1_Chr1-1g00544 [Microbotryum saponariae]
MQSFPTSDRPKISLRHPNMFAFMSTFITIAASVALAHHEHDQGRFRSAPILKRGNDASMSPIAKPGQWSKYDHLITAHALLAMITFWIAVPAAALVARFGRDTPGWIKYHRRLQGFWTVPATIAISILGLTAAGINGSIFKAGDVHHIVGIILLFLVLGQALGGYIAEKAPIRRRPDVNARPAIRILHPISGVVTALISWVQIRLGVNENGHHTRLLDVLNIVFVGGFLLVYAYGLAALVVERHAAGRSWFNSIFGLGRASASRPPQI